MHCIVCLHRYRIGRYCGCVYCHCYEHRNLPPYPLQLGWAAGQGTREGGGLYPLGSSQTRLHKATAVLTSCWGETCCAQGLETFRGPCCLLCCWVPCDPAHPPGLSPIPQPVYAWTGESMRRYAQTTVPEVHWELPWVSTSTSLGPSPAPATSELSCFSTLSPGLNGENELETTRGSSTSTAEGPKLCG